VLVGYWPGREFPHCQEGARKGANILGRHMLRHRGKNVTDTTSLGPRDFVIMEGQTKEEEGPGYEGKERIPADLFPGGNGSTLPFRTVCLAVDACNG